MIRRNIERLNAGDGAPAVSMFAKDATLTFPGHNSWSRMFREPVLGRVVSPTHRGRDEIEAFVRRYTDQGLQMAVEDILVNGPPWNMRAAAQVHDWLPAGGGDGDVYNNRAVLWVRVRWGKIVAQEDYEDTERVAALDHHLSVASVG
jgi:ketosteroid isomerase-like protein